jgi:predicted ATP-grasp superfamily ATP-dependent carboligase
MPEEMRAASDQGRSGPSAVDAAALPPVPGALILGGAHGSLAVARSLGRRRIPVWFVTNDHPLAGLSRYVQRRFSWGGPDRQDAVDFLLALGRLHHLEGWVLFAGGDPEVRLIAEHHAELSAIFRVTTPPWPITRFAYDKALTYRQAESIGVDCPRSFHPKDRAEAASLACRFPLVMKPSVRDRANAFTMAKGWKVKDRSELLERYDQAAALVGHDGILIQEFIPGNGSAQFSYAAVWRHGIPVASLIVRRLRQFPIEFGFSSTFVETVENDRVAEAASRFLRSLNYDGIVELEFKHDVRDDRYKLLDFNARSWTWIALAAAAGVDFPYLLWQAATGTGSAAAAAAGCRPATWMHSARDAVAAWQHIKAGSLTFADYLKSFRRPIVFAAFAWDDPLPGLLELPLSLCRALTRRVPFLPPLSTHGRKKGGWRSLCAPMRSDRSRLGRQGRPIGLG